MSISITQIEQRMGDLTRELTTATNAFDIVTKELSTLKTKHTKAHDRLLNARTELNGFVSTILEDDEK